jgi:hypothetical protein
VSLKHNQTGFGGKPEKSSGPAFAAGAVTALNEITKRQLLFLMIGFHEMKITKPTVPVLWGISPM